MNYFIFHFARFPDNGQSYLFLDISVTFTFFKLCMNFVHYKCANLKERLIKSMYLSSLVPPNTLQKLYNCVRC